MAAAAAALGLNGRPLAPGLGRGRAPVEVGLSLVMLMVGVSFMAMVGGVGADPLILIEGGPTEMVGMLGFALGRFGMSSGILMMGIGGLELVVVGLVGCSSGKLIIGIGGFAVAVVGLIGCSSGKLMTGMPGLLYDVACFGAISSGKLIIGIGGFCIVLGKSLGSGLPSMSACIDGGDLSLWASKTGNVDCLAGKELRPLSCPI